MKVNRRLLAIQALALIAIWVKIVYSVWSTRGLFDWLGIDYALYAGGARLMFSSQPWMTFDLDTLAGVIAPYHDYYGPAADDYLKVGPIPHHAVTFLQFAPFAALSPVTGYLSWVLVNFALAVYVLRSLASRFENGRWSITALALTFFPLVYTLFVGQPIVVMLFALTRAYEAWERQRDFEAGLWLGGLWLKVQYPLILLLVLVYKRRWRSVAGLFTTGAVFGLGMLAVFGIRGTLAYFETLRSLSNFRMVHPVVNPQQMIGWRGLLLNVLPPSIPDSQGKLVSLVLSGLTVASLLVVWRRRWDPTGPRFAAQMLATILVTMLACFHNHPHGATLLLAPAMILMAQGGGTPSICRFILASLYLPTLLFSITYSPELVATLLSLLMAGTLGALLVFDLSSEEAGPQRLECLEQRPKSSRCQTAVAR